MKLFIKRLILIVFAIIIFILISALVAKTATFNFIFIFSIGYITYPIINKRGKIKCIEESIYENRKN